MSRLIEAIIQRGRAEEKRRAGSQGLSSHTDYAVTFPGGWADVDHSQPVGGKSGVAGKKAQGR
jgi:hypothetical protein